MIFEEKWILVGLFVIVLIVYPAVAWGIRGWRLKALGADPSKAAKPPVERALALPNGSIRAMLALLTVGTFVLVLAFATKDHFEQVLTAFGTLTGAMIGFYFGTRTAQKKDDIPQQDDVPLAVTPKKP